MKTYSIRCAMCPRVFESVRGNSKYCSDPCRKAGTKKNNTKTKVCVGCRNSFTYQYHDPNRVYCTSSCAAEINNKLFPKRKPTIKKSVSCPRCKGPKTKEAQYCKLCSPEIFKENRIKAWLSGEWDGSGKLHKHNISCTVRNYLLLCSNYSCSKCGFNDRHPDDNSCLLEINHIDGNSLNHSPSNLEVLCPNCHAKTPNYRGRNMGKGRPYRYKIKAEL